MLIGRIKSFQKDRVGRHWFINEQSKEIVNPLVLGRASPK